MPLSELQLVFYISLYYIYYLSVWHCKIPMKENYENIDYDFFNTEDLVSDFSLTLRKLGNE
jgi:hypothetical protein